MTETDDQQSWWSKPKKLIVLAFAVITGLAALIGAMNTIGNQVGFGTKVAEISLRVYPVSMRGAGVYEVPVDLLKTGQGVLHNCNFSSWLQGFQMETDSPMKSFTIPDGSFSQSSAVYITLPRPFMVVAKYGELILGCDNASSPSVRFATP